MAARVDGQAELVQLCGRFPGELADDMDQLALDTAQRIIDVARPPRVSGELARSQAVDARGGITASAVHAGPIRFGWPRRNIVANDWLSPAAAQVADDLPADAELVADQALARNL